ncbi:MAG: RDD family protein [ANME-2 cluster archaeon]|jgi:uncharacterized RDD family membrane protein YckC|nr:MAG: RDD family protein [ANME-2 cluster archaeon]
MEGPNGTELAGVGSRFVSYLIDAIIINLIGYALMFALVAVGASYMPAMYAPMLIGLAYFTYFFGSGQTPGMKVMNIKLIRTDGDPAIGYGKGFLRWIGMLISAMVIGLGFLWILIDKNKQGWHDKIADVYVVAANR